MSENSKPITKYITLKVTYNSYHMESPETWDWNELVDTAPDENIEVFSIREFPPSAEF